MQAVIDPLRVEQLLTQLLDNAIKFSPQGGEIRVELRRRGPDEVQVAVRVHGVGVAPEQRASIVDRFYNVTDPRAHGSGLSLGLHLAREIAQLHGGWMGAEFPDSGGSRFFVVLPLDGSGRAKADEVPFSGSRAVGQPAAVAMAPAHPELGRA